VIEFFFSSVSFCITKKEFWHEKRPENIPHLMILNKRERERLMPNGSLDGNTSCAAAAVPGQSIN
jgi:hypothetical protein